MTGRVQGVFYRATARRMADQFGVTGWVRNEPDGSVRAEVQGDDAGVDAMVRWCRDGPAAARVTGIDIREIGLRDGESTFRVR